MANDSYKLGRRDLIRRGIQALVVIGGSRVLLACEKQDPTKEVAPEDVPQKTIAPNPEDPDILIESSETAKSFNYHYNTMEVDTTRFTEWEKNQMCSTCRNFKPVGDGKYGRCMKIPTEALVAQKGWCSAWVPRV